MLRPTVYLVCLGGNPIPTYYGSIQNELLGSLIFLVGNLIASPSRRFPLWHVRLNNELESTAAAAALQLQRRLLPVKLVKNPRQSKISYTCAHWRQVSWSFSCSPIIV